MILLLLLLIPTLAFASPKTCVTNDGDTYPYEEFDIKGAADLFAGETLKANIVKEQGKDIWRVYLRLPYKTCASITEG